jgi:hypothetical protein
MRERRHDAAQGAGDEASHEARWNGTVQNGSSYANENGKQAFGWDGPRRKDINCSSDAGTKMVESPQDADLKLETGRFLNNSLADIVSAACFYSLICRTSLHAVLLFTKHCCRFQVPIVGTLFLSYIVTHSFPYTFHSL